MGLEGRTLGNFVVEEEIGRGGMGVVLRARQPLLDRLAVLKKVRRELAELPELAERFQREARAAGAIHHPNVVSVYDHFTWRGDHYIAQEYVDGVDLDAAIDKLGRLPWRQAALIVLELTRGLEEIHAQGTFHRDLKPSNILVGRRGEVKIADFGVALEAKGGKLTQPGTLVGTPPYMPPEQIKGTRADTRSDLFSLGVVFYELLTGERPFAEPEEGGQIEDLLRNMEKERYAPVASLAPRTPRAGRRIVRSCLRAKPNRRIGSARELRVRLEQLLDTPSPADVRSEIAIHFWEQGVFETRADQTLVLAPASTYLPSRPGFGWLPASLAAAVIVATLLLVDIRPVAAPRDARSAAAQQRRSERAPEQRALEASLIATSFDSFAEWSKDEGLSPMPALPQVFEPER